MNGLARLAIAAALGAAVGVAYPFSVAEDGHTDNLTPINACSVQVFVVDNELLVNREPAHVCAEGGQRLVAWILPKNGVGPSEFPKFTFKDSNGVSAKPGETWLRGCQLGQKQKWLICKVKGIKDKIYSYTLTVLQTNADNSTEVLTLDPTIFNN